jgi:putative SOS response-associated peptidase YedK
MINARAEGIESKPSFKKPLRFQRCIIPASAFFEWKGNPGAKVKYRIARQDGELFGFAGLYESWQDPSGGELATCSIITIQPNDLVAPIHNRMPVILLPEDEDHWLDPDMTEPEAIVSLLQPYPVELLAVRACLAVEAVLHSSGKIDVRLSTVSRGDEQCSMREPCD